VSKPRVIVVTGATSDSGRAVASALLDAGNTVVTVGSNEERLATVAASFRFVCDLTDVAAAAALAARVREETGRPDGLVHLVGGWRSGHEPEDWAWLEPRLLTSLRAVTLAFHDDLGASDAGRLVVVGSASAAKPTWSGANYAVLKTAADAWVAGVASGWRKAGTAAAVTFVVKSLSTEAGGDGTSVATLAEAIEPLWHQSAADLNGAHIPL
jgi:NAD(P)-dependent dehydrogenase (short-subunit alcohol dehydrogenase family)